MKFNAISNNLRHPIRKILQRYHDPGIASYCYSSMTLSIAIAHFWYSHMHRKKVALSQLCLKISTGPFFFKKRHPWFHLASIWILKIGQIEWSGQKRGPDIRDFTTSRYSIKESESGGKRLHTNARIRLHMTYLLFLWCNFLGSFPSLGRRRFELGVDIMRGVYPNKRIDNNLGTNYYNGTFVFCFSRKLNKVVANYSIFEREQLSLVYGLLSTRSLLLFAKVAVVLDAKGILVLIMCHNSSLQLNTLVPLTSSFQ